MDTISNTHWRDMQLSQNMILKTIKKGPYILFKHRYEYNITIGCREIGCENGNWI